MIEKAYGKINLSINVKARREDGYHIMDMIMLPVDLYDILEIEVSDKTEYESNTSLGYDKTNIIYRCIEQLRSECGFKEQFKIKLTKLIPMEAGLAGGSADGAAALRAVNKLLNLNLTNEQLCLVGKKVGSDIPFCIYSTCARVQGVGDKVTVFDYKGDYDVVLIKPEKGVSTKESFGLLDLEKCEHPDMDKLQEAFETGAQFTELLGNSLNYGSFQITPEIKDVINDAKSLGYPNTLMSGSGSTVFVLVDKGTDTEKLEMFMKRKYSFVKKASIMK